MKNTKTQQSRALLLAALIISSVAIISVSTGLATAAVDSDSFTVTTDAVQSDGTITIDGSTDSGTDSDVTFLIQDPADSDVATVTKTVAPNFSTTIDLGSLSFAGGDGTLDEGEATVLADEDSSFTAAEASDTVVIDDSKPTASLDSPSDAAELTGQPTIVGTATDDTTVDTVELVIERQSDGKYYNGSAFGDTKQRVAASGTTDWSYDTATAGINTDDNYDVSVIVTDTAGNERETVVPQPDSETTEITYTVDTTSPSITNVTVVDTTDGDGTVESGDTISVTADVTDTTAGVETVTVDGSQLGASETEELTADTQNTYTTSFTVENPTIGDGSFDLTLTATDAFGNSAQTTESDVLTLSTAVADVGSLSVDHDFVGIVRDDDTAVTVTATGITDPQGNTITGPTTVDIAIAGETVETAEVTDGTVSTEINTVANLSNDTATGDATVTIAQADADAASTTVELVHEAQSLEEGYQVRGTPMPLAEDPVFESVADVTTYDPTATGEESEWVTPAVRQSGEGYYIEGENDDARIGYVFDETANDDVEARTLNEGFNLVGASPALAEQTSVTTTTDLGGAINVDTNDNVDVWVRDDSVELDQSTNTSAYNEVGGSETVTAYEGYFVYIDSGQEYRNVEITSYEPANRTG